MGGGVGAESKGEISTSHQGPSPLLPVTNRVSRVSFVSCISDVYGDMERGESAQGIVKRPLTLPSVIAPLTRDVVNVDDHSNRLHASIECCACALLSPQHKE